MQQVQNFVSSPDASAIAAVHWKPRKTCDQPDVESAILLRSLVLPAFEHARTWKELVEALDSIGFGLAIANGHLALTEADTGARICTGRFLGMPLAQLSERMGKPVVRALGEGDGEFLF